MKSWKNETRPVAIIRPCLRKTTRIIFWEIFFRARRFQSLTESIVVELIYCSMHKVAFTA